MNGTHAFDGLFDADLATVQRTISEVHVTGRDVVTIEIVEKAHLSEWYRQPYWSNQP